MNPLNASLAWRSAAGRPTARVSFFVRVLGVGFATLVLLLAASASDALHSRGDRIGWRTEVDMSAAEGITPSNAWFQVSWSDDYYLEHAISHVRVVQRAPEAIVPPGLPRIPGAGEVFVSPALAKLIDADPEILGNRYGDTIVGTISRDGLSHAGELVAISGEAANDANYRGVLYRELPTGFHESALTLFMRVVIIIGVVVMLFPIAMFIASAARLDAQESDARLAAFRLAGADPAQVRWIVAWGALFSALPGVLLGLVFFFAARPLVAQVELDGRAFFASDFALNGLSLLALLAVPVVVTAASFVGLRDVEISPLGVVRNAARKKVRATGFLFLLPGFALLWYSLDLADAGGDGVFATVGLVGSVLLILIGVALIGTWVGQLAARLLAAKVRSGSSLLAFRRIVADPHASFRTVSGVTFAVFAGTLFLSLSAALEREVQTEPLSGLRSNVLWASYPYGAAPVIEGLPEGSVSMPMNFLSAMGEDDARLTVQQADCDLLARIVRMEGGCEGRVAIREGSMVQPGDTIIIDLGVGITGIDRQGEPPVRFTIPADAHLFAGANMGGWTPDVVLPPGTFDWSDEFNGGVLMVAPPEGIGPGDRAFEQIRTALIRSHPAAFTYAAGEFDAAAVGGLATMRNLVYSGTFAAFALSGATAAMAVAGGILARRRPFALLRMSGCSLGTLRRTVIAEATLPLALVSVVSAATAVAASTLMIWRIGEGSVLPPPAFILPLVAGLAVGLALPLLTLPMLGHVTSTERTRFE